MTNHLHLLIGQFCDDGYNLTFMSDAVLMSKDGQTFTIGTRNWDSMAFDESNGVGVGRLAGINALGKASKVGEGFDPKNVLIRTGAEGRVLLEGLAHDFINDSVGLRRGIVIHAQVWSLMVQDGVVGLGLNEVWPRAIEWQLVP